MTTLQFQCTLLSDVILNQKAATEGHQESLDFIPGSNFLGIVASQIYNALSPMDAWKIFHSGSVRFGDAHPGKNKKRALRVPACMFYPKLKKASEVCYLHHYYHRENDQSDKGNPWQLKQCRNGFYLFDDHGGTLLDIQKSFAIKSAYDRTLRRSKDEQMYGYQSIAQGSTFYFEVTLDDATHKFEEEIRKALCGQKRIGRSRTAQYGLVNIKEETFENVKSNPETQEIDGKSCIIIYADSRLIFIDNYGLPTFQPDVKQHLNFPEGTILWDKSQIRTFQYAPWNFTRQSRDADRCGIEKGSIIVVEIPQGLPVSTQEYLGLYQNEGFGKVIYNPEFLKVKKDTNGEAAYTLQEPTNPTSNPVSPLLNKTALHNGPDTPPQTAQCTSNPTSCLLNYLNRQKQEAQALQTIYQKVNEFVQNHGDLFQGKAFAAQWGNIRNIAMQKTTKSDICEELFFKKTERNGEKISNAYLTHGVAEDKWKERGRINILKKFIQTLPAEIVQLTIINLASEMAKNCRRK